MPGSAYNNSSINESHRELVFTGQRVNWDGIAGAIHIAPNMLPTWSFSGRWYEWFSDPEGFATNGARSWAQRWRSTLSSSGRTDAAGVRPHGRIQVARRTDDPGGVTALRLIPTYLLFFKCEVRPRRHGLPGGRWGQGNSNPPSRRDSSVLSLLRTEALGSEGRRVCRWIQNPRAKGDTTHGKGEPAKAPLFIWGAGRGKSLRAPGGNRRGTLTYNRKSDGARGKARDRGASTAPGASGTRAPGVRGAGVGKPPGPPAKAAGKTELHRKAGANGENRGGEGGEREKPRGEKPQGPRQKSPGALSYRRTNAKRGKGERTQARVRRLGRYAEENRGSEGESDQRWENSSVWVTNSG